MSKYCPDLICYYSSEWLFTLFFCLCHASAKYLELRFNRATRLLGTVLFIVQTVSKKSVNT